jgi:hypothetical protein
MSRTKEAAMTENTQDKITPGPHASPPSLEVDVALYDHYLEECGWSDEQKRQFLEALWSIIVDFVALGFDVHPAQHAQDTCGKLPKTPSTPPITGRNAVQLSPHFITHNFKAAAKNPTPSAPERIQK